MNIGIIGSGNVGGTLGARWAQLGHHVTFSSRNPNSAEMQALIQRAGPNARAASTAEAAASANVLLLATPWAATPAALESAGSLAGKILIDATNPLTPDVTKLMIGLSTSGAEQIASWAPGARVVKAFNTIGYNVMANPVYGEAPVHGQAPVSGQAKAVLFYCGDDAEAKATARELALELGFDPRDVGPLTQARLLEPVAMLWISMAVFHGFGFQFAYQWLDR